MVVMSKDGVCPFTAIAYLDEAGRAALVKHPDSGRVVAFEASDDAYCFAVALGLAGVVSAGAVAAPPDALLHLIAADEEAADVVRQVAYAGARRGASTDEFDDHHVLAVLRASGRRGASHEDFLEAGLGPRYIAAMRRLVDAQGCDVSVEFTTGAARWVLVREPAGVPASAAA